jgi:hypothetical protein
MKKLTLLFLSLLGASATQANGLMVPPKRPALPLAPPVVTRRVVVPLNAPAKPLSTPTGYLNGMEMTPGSSQPHPYRAENVTISQSTYFRFSYYGPYGQDEPVDVDVVSTNAGAQLITGFDNAPNVWQITFDPSQVDYNDDAAEAVISVSDRNGSTTEYVITWPRTAWW